MKLVKIEHISVRSYEITVAKRVGFFWNRRTVTQKFFGSGTVWYDAATGKRQPTHIEMWLSDRISHHEYLEKKNGKG